MECTYITIDNKIIKAPKYESRSTRLLRSAVIRDFPEFYEYLCKIYPFLDPEKSEEWAEMKYLYAHNLDQRPVCPVCGKTVSFNKSKDKYAKYCSIACGNRDLGPSIEELIEKYGNITDWDEVDDVPDLTFLDEKSNDHLVREDYNNRNHPKFCIYLYNSFPKTYSFPEKLYLFHHGMKRRPKCKLKGCQKDAKFRDAFSGYRDHCCDKHRRADVSSKTLKRWLKEYERITGLTSPMKDPKVVEKSMATNRANHDGMLHVQTQEFIDAHRETSKKCMQIMRSRNKEIYGFEQATKNPEVSARISNTKRERFKEKNEDWLAGYTDKGEWIHKCTHLGKCELCKEKTFVISASLKRSRIDDGSELCTILNPIGSGRKSGWGPSDNELENRKILKEMGIDCVYNDRSTISPWELDLKTEEEVNGRKIAIEENGPWCHCIEMNREEYGDVYHMMKSLKCMSENTELITSWGEYTADLKKIIFEICFAEKDKYTLKTEMFSHLKDNEWSLDLGWPPYGYIKKIKKHYFLHRGYLCSDSGVAILDFENEPEFIEIDLGEPILGPGIDPKIFKPFEPVVVSLDFFLEHVKELSMGIEDLLVYFKENPPYGDTKNPNTYKQLLKNVNDFLTNPLD